MNKTTATTMIIAITGLVFLGGCAQQTQQVQAKTAKQKDYAPMKVSESAPEVKHEPLIDIDKNDVEQYKRDQAQLGDFDKHMMAREKRHRNK